MNFTIGEVSDVRLLRVFENITYINQKEFLEACLGIVHYLKIWPLTSPNIFNSINQRLLYLNFTGRYFASASNISSTIFRVSSMVSRALVSGSTKIA